MHIYIYKRESIIPMMTNLATLKIHPLCSPLKAGEILPQLGYYLHLNVHVRVNFPESFFK